MMSLTILRAAGTQFHNIDKLGQESMAPLILTRYTVVSALGKGLDETYRALRNRRSGLRPCDFEDVGITTYIGRVDDVEDVFVGGGSGVNGIGAVRLPE